MITPPIQFSDSSKVWVYQADRKLSKEELTIVEPQINDFVKNWVSHQNHLKAYGTILFNQFIVLIVDESKALASGCSIDSSVAFVKNLGVELEIDFFNRWNFFYLDRENNLQMVSKDKIQKLYDDGKIDSDTLFIDPLIKTLGELKNGFIKNLSNGWQKNFLNVSI